MKAFRAGGWFGRKKEPEATVGSSSTSSHARPAGSLAGLHPSASSDSLTMSARSGSPASVRKTTTPSPPAPSAAVPHPSAPGSEEESPGHSSIRILPILVSDDTGEPSHQSEQEVACIIENFALRHGSLFWPQMMRSVDMHKGDRAALESTEDCDILHVCGEPWPPALPSLPKDAPDGPHGRPSSLSARDDEYEGGRASRRGSLLTPGAAQGGAAAAAAPSGGNRFSFDDEAPPTGGGKDAGTLPPPSASAAPGCGGGAAGAWGGGTTRWPSPGPDPSGPGAQRPTTPGSARQYESDSDGELLARLVPAPYFSQEVLGLVERLALRSAEAAPAIVVLNMGMSAHFAARLVAAVPSLHVIAWATPVETEGCLEFSASFYQALPDILAAEITEFGKTSVSTAMVYSAFHSAINRMRSRGFVGLDPTPYVRKRAQQQQQQRGSLPHATTGAGGLGDGAAGRGSRQGSVEAEARALQRPFHAPGVAGGSSSSSGGRGGGGRRPTAPSDGSISSAPLELTHSGVDGAQATSFLAFTSSCHGQQVATVRDASGRTLRPYGVPVFVTSLECAHGRLPAFSAARLLRRNIISQLDFDRCAAAAAARHHPPAGRRSFVGLSEEEVDEYGAVVGEEGTPRRDGGQESPDVDILSDSLRLIRLVVPTAAAAAVLLGEGGRVAGVLQLTPEFSNGGGVGAPAVAKRPASAFAVPRPINGAAGTGGGAGRLGQGQEDYAPVSGGGSLQYERLHPLADRGSSSGAATARAADASSLAPSAASASFISDSNGRFADLDETASASPTARSTAPSTGRGALALHPDAPFSARGVPHAPGPPLLEAGEEGGYGTSSSAEASPDWTPGAAATVAAANCSSGDAPRKGSASRAFGAAPQRESSPDGPVAAARRSSAASVVAVEHHPGGAVEGDDGGGIALSSSSAGAAADPHRQPSHSSRLPPTIPKFSASGIPGAAPRPRRKQIGRSPTSGIYPSTISSLNERLGDYTAAVDISLDRSVYDTEAAALRETTRLLKFVETGVWRMGPSGASGIGGSGASGRRSKGR